MSHPALAIAGFYDHEEQTERRAPDWGGDDLFTTVPTRRRGEHATPRRRGDDDHHGAARERGGGAHPPDAEPRAQRERAPHGSEQRALHRYEQPVPAGRRTVTITGRPQESHVARRPARTLDERIAHRPERIASWTCAMGCLLILLAILTSH